MFWYWNLLVCEWDLFIYTNISQGLVHESWCGGQLMWIQMKVKWQHMGQQIRDTVPSGSVFKDRQSRSEVGRQDTHDDKHLGQIHAFTHTTTPELRAEQRAVTEPQTSVIALCQITNPDTCPPWQSLWIFSGGVAFNTNTSGLLGDVLDEMKSCCLG